mmetsp:Transcript_4892/g.7402  ORF Transcript_4892/g.7402 Transcript_4892/m.7402 type:complete len:95 (-) Transcript_4892:18-302(-)
MRKFPSSRSFLILNLISEINLSTAASVMIPPSPKLSLESLLARCCLPAGNSGQNQKKKNKNLPAATYPASMHTPATKTECQPPAPRTYYQAFQV